VAAVSVKTKFEGGRITSDGGVMLLAQAERRLGIADRLARVIPDERDADRVVHLLPDILRARIFAIACGYEDADDLDAFKLACGRLPDTGRDLCSQPTVSRWENAPSLRLRRPQARCAPRSAPAAPRGATRRAGCAGGPEPAVRPRRDFGETDHAQENAVLIHFVEPAHHPGIGPRLDPFGNDICIDQPASVHKSTSRAPPCARSIEVRTAQRRSCKEFRESALAPGLTRPFLDRDDDHCRTAISGDRLWPFLERPINGLHSAEPWRALPTEPLSRIC